MTETDSVLSTTLSFIAAAVIQVSLQLAFSRRLLSTVAQRMVLSVSEKCISKADLDSWVPPTPPGLEN